MDSKTIKDFISIIKEDKTTVAPYDTTATVTRIEGQTAWVHIPGGVDETPVSMAINAQIGDNVRIRLSGGQAWITGNDTAPPTDDAKAVEAKEVAVSAEQKADTAQESADRAQDAADRAERAADNANEYASRALVNLSTVQSVAETLTWITQHGTMTLTTDTEIDPTHVYFVQDANGDYVVGGTHYSVVIEPNVDDLGSYYVLSIDESLNNYVATHLAVTSEGLWVLPDSSGYKVLIATGNGTTYTTAGTYIIDPNGSIVAKFGVETEIGNDGSGRLSLKNKSILLTNEEKEEIFCITNDGELKTKMCFFSADYSSNYYFNIASVSGYAIYVTYAYRLQNEEGWPHEGSTTFYGGTSATHDITIQGSRGFTVGYFSQQSEPNEGVYISNRASFVSRAVIKSVRYYAMLPTSYYTIGTRIGDFGDESHVLGYSCEASGKYSHAQNSFTTAKSDNQTVIGKFNKIDSNGKYAFIVGNGASTSALSNAYALTWDGDMEIGIDTSAASGTVDGDLYAAITALAWESEVIV